MNSSKLIASHTGAGWRAHSLLLSSDISEMRCSRAAPERGAASLAAAGAAAPVLLGGRPLLLQPGCAPAALHGAFPLGAPLLASFSAACMLVSRSLPQEVFLLLAAAAEHADDAVGPVSAGKTWLDFAFLMLLLCLLGGGQRGSACRPKLQSRHPQEKGDCCQCRRVTSVVKQIRLYFCPR